MGCLAAVPIVASDDPLAPCRVSDADAIAVVRGNQASLGDKHPQPHFGDGSMVLITADGYSGHSSADAALTAAGLDPGAAPHCIFNAFVVYERSRNFPDSPCRVHPELQRCSWQSFGIFVYRLDGLRDPSDPSPLNFMDSWDYSDTLISWGIEFDWIQEGPQPTPQPASAKARADAGGRAPTTAGPGSTTLLWRHHHRRVPASS